MSLINSNSQQLQQELLHTPGALQAPVNPFEETNKFRLEQSVLSPNLFHVASTSTPERDTGCLWNIDQRAVLYPANIPTDESSLIAQYIYDNRMSKQVSAAVEAFWTQNKIIIESPLASTNPPSTNSGNSIPLKNRFGLSNNGYGTGTKNSSSSSSKNNFNKKSSISVNSPLSYDIKNQFSSNSNRYYYGSAHGASASVSSLNSNSSGPNQNASRASTTSEHLVKIKSNKKDQTCQTILSFPINLDLNKIAGLKDYLIDHIYDENDSPHKKHSHHQLNNSIRKKLFDQNSDDYSSTTTTHSAQNNEENYSITSSGHKSKSHHNHHQTIQNTPGNTSRLPRPELPSSSTESIIPKQDLNKLKTLATTSSSNGDWDDSFEFEDQRASSPKNNKILFDFDHDPNDDSVFESKHKTPPDLSPLMTTPKKQSKEIESESDPNQMEMSMLSNSLFTKNLQHQHHQRYFHFDLAESASKKQEKVLSSPNLSPIHLENKPSSLGKKRFNNTANDLNSSSGSSCSTQGAKSIIFMDYADKDEEKPRNFTSHNLSFIEPITSNENHYKREEIYTNHLYHETKSPANLVEPNDHEHENELINNTYQNVHSNQSLTNIQQESLIASNLSRTNSCLNMSTNTKKKLIINQNENKTLLNSNETSSNTFLINQSSSQDTGYHTNLGSVCPNGSSSNSSANPSIMLMDTTNLNNKTNELKKPSSLNLLIGNVSGNVAENAQTINVTSTPMSIGDEEFNFNSFNNFVDSKNKIQPNIVESQIAKTTNKKTKAVKHNDIINRSSISLNSLESIQPVESSTPEKLKHSNGFLSKSFKSANSSAIGPKTNKSSNNSSSKVSNVHNKTSPVKTCLNFSSKLKSSNYQSNSQVLSSKSAHGQNQMLKSKTTFSLSLAQTNNINLSNKIMNKSQNKLSESSQSEKIKYFKVYGSNSRNNLDCDEDTDEYDKYLTNLHEKSNLENKYFNLNRVNQSKSNPDKILRDNNSCDDLTHKKHEIDFSFLENSFLARKFNSPSEYAQKLIENAKKDLSATDIYIKKTTIQTYQSFSNKLTKSKLGIETKISKKSNQNKSESNSISLNRSRNSEKLSSL